MPKAVDGAKGCQGKSAEPDANNPAVDCPCNIFLRCSTRIPYGAEVWADENKKQIAMSAISYKSVGVTLVLTYTRGLVKKLRADLSEDGTKPLVFRGLDEKYIKDHMDKLKIHNGVDFTNFQKLMVGRANLVQNNLVMRSDVYSKKKGGYEQVIPASGQYESNEWNVDHIYSKSKGGCNRFCNAQMLGRQANIKKNNKAFGCICAQTVPNATEDKFSVNGKTDSELWKCNTLCNNGKKPPNKVPQTPPGMIDGYPDKNCKICTLDNPCEWSEALQKSRKAGLKKEIDKIC